MENRTVPGPETMREKGKRGKRAGARPALPLGPEYSTSLGNDSAGDATPLPLSPPHCSQPRPSPHPPTSRLLTECSGRCIRWRSSRCPQHAPPPHSSSGSPGRFPPQTCRVRGRGRGRRETRRIGLRGPQEGREGTRGQPPGEGSESGSCAVRGELVPPLAAVT